MIPMCNVSGVIQGWAIAVGDCDGTVTLGYYDEDGAFVDDELPAGWKPCIQGEPGPEWSPTHTDVAYAATVNIDFAAAEYISIDDVTGNLTFTGSNYAAPRHIRVRVVESGGSSRALTFPTWTFVGTKPTAIAANKTGLLELISYGSSAASVVARWTVQT